MSSAAARTVATEVSLKEHAEALVGAGQLRKAAALINAHLAEFDAGWKLWNTLAGLSRRLGRYELAVAAWRASARQLEAAGHLKHAHAALESALRLMPSDQSLRDEVSRLSRLVKQRAPGPASRPTLRIVRARSSESRPTLKIAPAPRPAARRAPSPPSRSTNRPAPNTSALRRPLEIVTDPHLAIFDILDDEKHRRR